MVVRNALPLWTPRGFWEELALIVVRVLWLVRDVSKIARPINHQGSLRDSDY